MTEKDGIRKRGYRSAIVFGGCYGTFQAIFPPVGELGLSLAIHVILLMIFLGLVCRHKLLPAIFAIACYLGILSLAISLPFKFMDSRVNMQTDSIGIDVLPTKLKSAGYTLIHTEGLPPLRLRLPNRQPTLRELDQALKSQFGYSIRRMPICANAFSISFLWGVRASFQPLIIRKSESPPNNRAAQDGASRRL